MIITSYILMVLVFHAYIIYLVNNFGVLSSISESFYSLQGSYKRLFICWGAVMASCMIIITYGSLYGFLAGIGMFIVATVPLFKQALGKWLHYIGAGLAFVSSYVFLSLNDNIGISIISIWSQLILFVLFRQTKNYLWWAEIIAFYTIFFGLIKYL